MRKRETLTSKVIPSRRLVWSLDLRAKCEDFSRQTDLWWSFGGLLFGFVTISRCSPIQKALVCLVDSFLRVVYALPRQLNTEARRPLATRVT